jgi:dienelactone hydrolase
VNFDGAARSAGIAPNAARAVGAAALQAKGGTSMKCTLTLAFFSLMIPAVAAAQEKVSFPSTDGDLKGGTPTTITGYLYKPAGSGPFGAVVSMPGCDGLLDEKGEIKPWYGQWGEILSRAGYIVLSVDSFRPRGRNSMCGDFGIGLLREILRDDFGGMNYLRARPDVRPNSIALLGQSYGGSAVMFTTADGELPRDVSPGKDFRAAVAFYPTCVRIEDAHWRPRQPMLLLMGELDNGGSLARCKELIGPQIDAHFYPNAHHLFDALFPVTTTNLKTSDGHLLVVGSNPEARADAINRVTQFLSKQLQ